MLTIWTQTSTTVTIVNSAAKWIVKWKTVGGYVIYQITIKLWRIHCPSLTMFYFCLFVIVVVVCFFLISRFLGLVCQWYVYIPLSLKVTGSLDPSCNLTVCAAPSTVLLNAPPCSHQDNLQGDASFRPGMKLLRPSAARGRSTPILLIHPVSFFQTLCFNSLWHLTWCKKATKAFSYSTVFLSVRRGDRRDVNTIPAYSSPDCDSLLFGWLDKA